MSEPDFGHVGNIARAAFNELRPRFAPPIAEAVVAHYARGAPLAGSLPETDSPESLIEVAERIIREVDKIAAGDDEARRKCLEIVRERAEARVKSDAAEEPESAHPG